ncbi:MAG TPA: RDD family protein [Candidatus Dormibacteraeota bacterium]|nr:RDD family protein [Candidatus Dormibacteraeota bacterium]
MVSTLDSVPVAAPPTGRRLRDEYVAAVGALTFGLVRFDGDVLRLGPLDLLRFGAPRIGQAAVEWPITGGLLSRRPGGTLRIAAHDGRVDASLAGWTPSLPLPIYRLTQLQVHLLFTRLYLLRVRGREPAPGRRATRQARIDAAAVDAAFCLTLAGLIGRRRLRRVVAIAAIYHVACWSMGGQTLGGLVMRQRVVAVDGSRLTPAQALLRFALLPLAWLTRRPVHDELAASDVISD